MPGLQCSSSRVLGFVSLHSGMNTVYSAGVAEATSSSDREEVSVIYLEYRGCQYRGEATLCGCLPAVAVHIGQGQICRAE